MVKFTQTSQKNSIAIRALKKEKAILDAGNKKLEKIVESRLSPKSNPILMNDLHHMENHWKDNKAQKQYYEFGKNLFAILNKNIPRFTNISLADYGCGSGSILKAFCEKAKAKDCNIYASDFSSQALKLADDELTAFKKNNKVNFYKHDIYKTIKYKHDIVLCTEVLEHLEHPEKALKNLLLSLKNKGKLIITVPDGRADYTSVHINFWSKESFKKFILSNLIEGDKFKSKFYFVSLKRTHISMKNNICIITKN